MPSQPALVLALGSAGLVGTLVASACGRGGPRIDYRSADPIAAARRAFIDSGHFHLLAVKVGDSVLAPSDSSVLKEKTYNVQVGPEGPYVYLRVESGARPNSPSDGQLRYIKRYNTELFTLLDTNFMNPGLPPNKRLKLPGAHK